MRVLTHFVLWALNVAPASSFYTAAEYACLERHAAGRKRLVEIGCWHGVNLVHATLTRAEIYFVRGDLKHAADDYRRVAQNARDPKSKQVAEERLAQIVAMVREKA